MNLGELILKRIDSIIEESESLRIGDVDDECVNPEHFAKCAAWRTSALNCVQQLCPDTTNAYRKHAEQIAMRESSWRIPQDVAEFGELLRNLRGDVQAGLLASIANHARAETFDDFLDHARAYLRDNRKNEAGVIAGVVFEDSIRRVCQKHGIDTTDVNLDSLISALAKAGVLNSTKAKRARVAAHVRTKATHADWDHFELSDVFETIQVSDELISRELEQG